MEAQRFTDSWHRLGSTPSTALAEARLQLHWAVQLIAAAADALLPHRADDSHTNMRWNSCHEALVGHRIAPGFYIGVCVPYLTLIVVDDDHEIATEMVLSDYTLDEARNWLTEILRATTGDNQLELRIRNYDLPMHPVGHGARFSRDNPDAFRELARWYGNANLVLRALTAHAPSWLASATRDESSLGPLHARAPRSAHTTSH